jgi:NAD(P) transhydrogenase subunit alpha
MEKREGLRAIALLDLAVRTTSWGCRINTELEMSIYVLILAVPLGLELVHKVSPLLHTPLMSLTNAISAISVVGAILVAGSAESPGLSRLLGCIAVTASTINIVSGFLITDRMLKMFRKKERSKA